MNGVGRGIFVVGCPRSGTTLFQSLVAAHPQVASCPETFFFLRVVPSGRIARRTGLATRAAPHAFEHLREVGIPAPDRVGPVPTVRAYARAFEAAMDAFAASMGVSTWLEKTPAHLRLIEVIERHIRSPRFVHVIRSGLPTVTSLYEVTNQHPTRWDGARSLERCIRRWNADIERSLRQVGRPGHLFVSYERLVTDPTAVLTSVFAGLGLESERGVAASVAGFGEFADSVAQDAPWKATVSAPITDRNEGKVMTVLSDDERQLVAERVPSIDWLGERFPFA